MKRRRIGLMFFTIVIFAFLYAPIAVVLVNAFNSDELLVRWSGFTLQWFREVSGDERVQSDFITSVIVAALAAAISLIIALTGTLWWRGASRRMRHLFEATTYVRIILPEIVTALGLFVLFRRMGLELGIPTIVVGHVVFNSAYATIIIQARLATLDPSLEEAAADLGARPRRVFRRVTLPLLMPAVVVAGLLTFSFSFDDVVTSAFLAGTAAETLPVSLLGLARFRISPVVYAIGTAVMAVTMVSISLALYAVRRWGGGRLSGLYLSRRRKRGGDPL